MTEQTLAVAGLRRNAKFPAREFSETEQILAKRIWEEILNSPHGNLVKKIALSGVIFLLFSLGCSGRADVPPGDVNPANGSTTDDHGNARATATPVTSGMQIAGNIETGDDQDYFSIEVARGVRLRAAATGDVNTIGHLYDSSGRELAANDDDGEGMNFNVSAPIASAGTYYVRVTSAGTGTGMYRLTVTLIPDDHGNARATATPAMIGMAIDGEIDPGTDTDYFSIQVSSTDLTGIDFLILTAATTGDVDTVGALYDSSGRELAADDNGGSTGMNFELSSQIASAGTYYVRVAGSDTGMYRLTVTSMAGDHGNMRGSATPVTKGIAIMGNIDPAGDEDYFAIEVTSAELSSMASLILKAETTGDLDTMGHLYDSGGTPLAMNDDSAPSNSNFRFSHSITTAGTYYVRVASVGSAMGMYRLTVTFTSDDHGNTRDSATRISIGTPIDGEIDPGTDTDHFSIVVSSTDLTGIDFLTLRAVTTGGTNTIGAIYDSDGNELAADDNSGAGMNFDVSYNITSAGTYYVRVEGSGIGTYRLAVTSMPGDHGNNRDSATQISFGTQITGSINPGNDEDWFSVEVTSEQLPGMGILVLKASITNSAETIGYIYDSSGNQLVRNDNWDQGIADYDVSYDIASAGTYYIRVRSFYRDTRMYSLTVTSRADDHGNTRDSTTRVTSGTAVDGNIETENDEDYFSIEVTNADLSGAGIIVLRAVTTGGTNTAGTLYDVRGIGTLAMDFNSGTNTNFELSAQITSAGIYPVRVTSEGMGTGMYRLTVTKTAGDHGDTRDSATRAAFDTAIAGNIDSDTDEDYFSISVSSTDLTGKDVLELRAVTTGSTDTVGHIYDSNGNELATDDNSSTGMNFDVSYSVTTAGTYYVRVKGTASGMYSLTVTSMGRDHGNNRGSATQVTSATRITGYIDPGNDEDYFLIEVPRAGALTATTTSSVVGPNTVGTLYDSGGMQLATDDDSGLGSHFRISYSITTAGTYYIRVTSVGSGTGTYNLIVTFDVHGDTSASATSVTSGTAITGVVGQTSDNDYFSIAVPSGGTLIALTTGTTDTRGFLYDTDGTTELAKNQDSSPTDDNFRISYQLASAGTYYIRVTGSNTGAYVLTATFIADHSDARDMTATPVTSGLTITGGIDPAADEDYFRITVTRAGILTATTTGETNTVGAIYDSGGMELATDDNSGTGNNFDFSHNITAAGTYYVRVTSAGSDTGEYSLTVTFDDHGNAQAHATPVMSGTAIAGNIEAALDEDYFSIAVTGAGILTASTTGTTDTRGFLYDSDGMRLATDDDSGTGRNFSFSHQITTTGTYYIKVNAFSTNTGAYTLTVTFTP